MVSGTAAVGWTLTCSHGIWESFPAGYTYRWLREGAEISGAVSSAYTVRVADEGHSISCEVTASNSAGTWASEARAKSDSVPLLLTLAVNIVAPEVAVRGGGAVVVGKTLWCSSGPWTGAPIPTFSYRWLRDGVAIGGAESNSYTVAVADEGHSISCEVTAADAVGSRTAVSANSVAMREEARERREAEEAAATKKRQEEEALAALGKHQELAKIAAAGSVSVASSVIIVQSGAKATVKLTCTGRGTCAGKLTLTVTSKGKQGKKGKAERIGAAAFCMPGGKGEVVTITLTTAGRTLLKAGHGKLSGSLTMVKSSAVPASTQHKIVELVQKQATKAKERKQYASG